MCLLALLSLSFLFQPHTDARVGGFPTSIKSLWNSNLSQLQRSHTWAVTSFGLPTIILLVWRGVPLHLRQYWVQEVGWKDQWSLLGWQHPDKTLSQTGQPSYTWKEESLWEESQGSGQHFKAEPITCAKGTPMQSMHIERNTYHKNHCVTSNRHNSLTSTYQMTNLISRNTATPVCLTVKDLHI